MSNSLAPDPILSLKQVNVVRGERLVLADINLQLGVGEHLAILGPNGCGKSTLLKVLTRELYPLAVNPDGSRPEIRIFGRERWDLTELRRRLGVVSTELPGRPTLATSGFDAILTGFFSSSTLWPHLIVTTAMREQAEELLLQVNAGALHDQLVGHMSAGQQRRILIARALAGSRMHSTQHMGAASGESASETQMLLLDEPSNALDLAAQQDLRELLRSLAQAGVSVVLITHHTADIIPEIGRVLLMQGGRIVADDARSQLLTGPRLSELFGAPLELTSRNGYVHTW